MVHLTFWAKFSEEGRLTGLINLRLAGRRSSPGIDLLARLQVVNRPNGAGSEGMFVTITKGDDTQIDREHVVSSVKNELVTLQCA